MYGTDDQTTWFYYDLSRAYITPRTHLSPASNSHSKQTNVVKQTKQQKTKLLDPESVKNWSNDQLLKGYLIINGFCKFPANKIPLYPFLPR
jgi:hypothetical protein